MPVEGRTLRVGIFGGTFNPPHLGHLVCAGEALWQLELDHVLFMPVGDAPHKAIESDPGREARFELCRLAVLDQPEFELSRHEIDRQGPCYTVETLAALREQEPERELVLILGGDQAVWLPEWRQPERVLQLAEIGVAERDETRRADVTRGLEGLLGADRVRFFEMPGIDISSTLVRERVAAGMPFRHLVPDRVADRITKAGLYQQKAAV